MLGNRMINLMEMDIDNFFKAKSLMTSIDKIRIFQSQSTIEDIKSHLEQNHYDVAIMYNTDGNLSYLLLDDIISSNSFIDIIKTIMDNEKISSESSISEIINKFEDNEHVFVYDDNNFVGIITYADLNKYPIKVFCYMAIIEFEKKLREIITNSLSDFEWLKKLSVNDRNYIGGIYISEKADGVERYLIDCTNLIHLTEVLNNHEFRNKIGIENKKKYQSEMKRINDFRNAIMHNLAIVNSKNGGKEIYDFIDKLGQYLTNISI